MHMATRHTPALFRRRLTALPGVCLAIPTLLVGLLAGCATTGAPQQRPAQAVTTSGLQVQSVGWSRQRIHALATALPTLQQQYAVPSLAVSLVSEYGEGWSRTFTGPGSVSRPVSGFPADGLAMPLLASLTLAASESSPWGLRTPLGQIAPRHAEIQPYAESRPVDLLTAPYSESPAQARTALAAALEAATGNALNALLRGLVPSVTHSQLERRAGDVRLTTTANDFGAYLQSLIQAGARDPATAALLAAHGTVDARRGLYQGLGWSLERQPQGGVIAYQWSNAAGYHHLALLDMHRRRGLVFLTQGQQGRSLIEAALPLIDETSHALLPRGGDGR